MMQYDGELKLPKHFLVPPPSISRTTGEYLAHNGVSTFACSESQKIGHVTFFWNGNRAAPFDKKLETFHEVSLPCEAVRHWDSSVTCVRDHTRVEVAFPSAPGCVSLDSWQEMQKVEIVGFGGVQNNSYSRSAGVKLCSMQALVHGLEQAQSLHHSKAQLLQVLLPELSGPP